MPVPQPNHTDWRPSASAAPIQLSPQRAPKTFNVEEKDVVHSEPLSQSTPPGPASSDTMQESAYEMKLAKTVMIVPAVSSPPEGQDTKKW
jgi:hypothetical protein